MFDATGGTALESSTPDSNPGSYFTVLGPAALPYRDSSDAMPTYFNWRKASIYAGSNEVQRQIIAKAILKF